MGQLEEKHVRGTLFSRSLGKKPLLHIMLFLAATGWGTTAFYDLVKGTFGPKDEQVGTPALFLLLSVYILWYLRKKFLSLYETYMEEDRVDINKVSTRRRKVLVIFLSALNEADFTVLQRGAYDSFSHWIAQGHNPLKVPFDVIAYHTSKLEKVFVLTSPQTEKIFPYFKKEILQAFSSKFEMEKYSIGCVDDIEAYKAAFHYIYKASDNYRNEEIVIDVTSGTKLYSISGSYFSLLENRIIEYVQYGENQKLQLFQFDNKVLSEELSRK